MKRIETILIDAGETPMGTFTMSTNRPRRVVKARVVREKHWRRLMAVVRAVDVADRNFPHDQEKPREAMKALRAALSETPRHE